MISTMLFDLDGTLSNSAPGILGSLRKSFADVGLPWIGDDAGRSLLGPPFYESLPPFVGTERLPDIIARYREHYETGKYDTELYDGIPSLLGAVADRGVTLAVATSKPEGHAVPILDHLGLLDRFATVGGDTFEAERPTKADVVSEVLRRLRHPDPASVLMVGDRSHDVEGAAANGLRCLGAGWGYGSPGELSGAVEVFDRAADLQAALDRLLAGADAALD